MLSDPSSRRRLVLVVGVGGVLVVLAGVGVYGRFTGPPAAPSPSSEADTFIGTSSRPATAPPSPVTTTTAPPGDILPGLPHTNDADLYARAIAETLLAWDTMSRLTPDRHARQVLDDADPAGRETPALAGDVANYLPTLEVWQQLRHHTTAQSVTIDDAYIPESWDDIAGSTGAEHLRPGTVAVTIEATRHRTGMWFDEPATADHPIVFTVFLACQPAFERCHTLRLSRPNEPLP